MGKPVRVRDAPGLVWRQRAGDVWEARWQCRTDIVEKGFAPKSVKIWSGTTDPTKEQWDRIADVCVQLQDEMLVFSRGGIIPSIEFDGTLTSLMTCYRTDPDSSFKKLRWHSKQYYETLMGLIAKDHGGKELKEINARFLRRWHEAWATGGKLAVAHGKIGMLRTLFGFGATILEDPECIRLRTIMSGLRFEMPKPRTEQLTADQATAIRAMAHQKGRPSIALAQAFQFELMLRQKDVIGEWVPLGEPGVSEVHHTKFKWLRGIRWEEIDQNLILVHITSKRQKQIAFNLKNAPMVIEELALQFPDGLPGKGPIIRSEMDEHPWDAVEFRRWWRLCADACGLSKTVRNMDSRAGAISEAEDAQANEDDIRESATHSNASTTRRYMRGAKEKKVERVQILRIQSRNKTET